MTKIIVVDPDGTWVLTPRLRIITADEVEIIQQWCILDEEEPHGLGTPKSKWRDIPFIHEEI